VLGNASGIGPVDQIWYQNLNIQIEVLNMSLFILQPSISGMEPPFGDAFQNCSFADQALTSTDLLANNSDPDFMYELVSNPQYPQYPQFYLFSHYRPYT